MNREQRHEIGLRRTMLLFGWLILGGLLCLWLKTRPSPPQDPTSPKWDGGTQALDGGEQVPVKVTP